MILLETLLIPDKDIFISIAIIPINISYIFESYLFALILFSFKTIVIEPIIPNKIP